MDNKQTSKPAPISAITPVSRPNVATPVSPPAMPPIQGRSIADMYLSGKIEANGPVAGIPERREPLIEAPKPAEPAPTQMQPEENEPQAVVSAPIRNEATSEMNERGEWKPVLPPAPSAYAKQLDATIAMPDLGIINQLLANEKVHDILISGTQPIYIDAGNALEDSGLRFQTQEEVWKIANRIMDTIGQRWDPNRPLIDTRLPDGSRVNIVAPPMAVDGVSISIRKFPQMRVTLESMFKNGQVSQEVVDFLKGVVAARLNIIIAGGTGSGKTTMLNALSTAISPTERIVTIEDSAELRLQQPRVVRLESKAPTSVDAPETAVTIRDLVKNALRMRPDRIIVGEARGAEAFDMLQAMNTGHEGSMTTLHANTPRDVLARLETMVSLAMPQAPIRMVRAQIANTLHLIIQTNRTKGGQRRITHISEIAGMEGETITMQDLILFREANGNPAEYKWVAGSSRNASVTQAAQQAGLLRGGNGGIR